MRFRSTTSSVIGFLAWALLAGACPGSARAAVRVVMLQEGGQASAYAIETPSATAATSTERVTRWVVQCEGGLSSQVLWTCTAFENPLAPEVPVNAEIHVQLAEVHGPLICTVPAPLVRTEVKQGQKTATVVASAHGHGVAIFVVTVTMVPGDDVAAEGGYSTTLNVTAGGN